MKKPHLFYLSPLLLAVVWLFTLPACKKDEPRTVHIKGRVTEYGTGKPIADARIYMLCDNSVVLGPSGSSLTDSIITDIDGRFDRTYPDADLCGSLYLLPYKKGYFKGNEIDLTTEFKELDIILIPEAWLKIRAIPDLGNTSANVFCRGGGTSFEHDFNVLDGDSTFVFPYVFFGNSDIEIIWHSPPSSQEYRDTIFCPAQDTTAYTIHY